MSELTPVDTLSLHNQEYPVIYTNGVYLQTFPTPDGAEWREASPEDIARIEGAMQLQRDILRENEWRDSEMPIARDNVTALDFGDVTISGSIAQWQAYWLALRNWKEGGNPEFPEQSERPIRPS